MMTMTRNANGLLTMGLAAVTMAFVNWSHNSDALAYGVVTDHGTDLWAARVDRPARLIAKNINTILQGPTWMPDGKSASSPESVGEFRFG